MTADRRSLLIGAVSLVKGRLKLDGQALLAARNEIEDLLRANEFLKSAPFKTVSLMIRYGEIEDLDPDIGAISTKHSELPVTIELRMADLESLSLEELRSHFRKIVIDVLQDVAANFDLPFEFLAKAARS